MQLVTEVITTSDASSVVQVVQRNAVAFLETGGAQIECRREPDVRRLGRRKRDIEVVACLVFEAPDLDDALEYARELEASVRSALRSHKILDGDVRVGVREDGGERNRAREAS